MPATKTLPRVNAVPLCTADEILDEPALRQRACTELLRQAAMGAGLLPADDPAPAAGAISEAASEAIEALLAHELAGPEPSEDACRRWHAAHGAQLARGERVLARHVLFGVTPGIDIHALRQRAEACLLELRCEDGGSRFAEVAAATSNCPSGAGGGSLGWLTADDCAPEFAREIFGQTTIGVLPRLVATRFGLHVVEVLAREAGSVPSFDTVRAAVAQRLRQQAFATALRHYLQALAGAAAVDGVELQGSGTVPLQQPAGAP